ncbi:MAG TPA: VWA domain-containing protein [Thioploca sp.]|nr:MAG: hypothetical protein B6247_05805 [Beggiatoa sp. 4572_84]RKZ57990.1 MAG: hypothetical protein DRR08_17590 [Gammaproteobacteria bacterium]HDN26183.1 VWA domain-containing protein [Thioploca sp.]
MDATEAIDVVVSFDTTGSMYPCLTQVRRNVKSLIKRLFKDIPGIRIGIIAHGDYCDAGNPYITKMLDLSTNESAICDFVQRVEPTFGGDSPECYELVLHEARSLSWIAGKSKVLVLIGDDVPHGPTYPMNTKNINWRNELGLLLEAGINVYAVQALGRRHATAFYREVAEKTGGFHLELNQFATVVDMIMAVCFKQYGDIQLQQFEEELANNGRINRQVDKIIGTLMGREESERFTDDVGELGAVDGGRFQVLEVDADVPIKKFVLDNGLTFKTGRGFYEFTKRVKVQANKEVILQDLKTGDLFSGDKARQMAGIPIGESCNVSPLSCPGYRVFIQSTSYNRKLLAGTKFLYEIDDWVD